MKKGIIINQDDSCLYHYIARVLDTNPLTAEDFEKFPLQYKDSGVTDYFICLNATVATYPSKVMTSYVDKYHQKLENGEAVDYSTALAPAAAHYLFEILGIDHIAIQIDGFRKIGINPWVSFRMNDFHNYHEKTSVTLSDFFHSHPEMRRVKFHPEFLQGCSDLAYDYMYDAVREYFLTFIDESLDRYDPYGIELDFQREMTIFSMGNEYRGIELMNDFIRKVDGIVHKYEDKYGHEIKIAVRVAGDIQINFDFGLDVMQWVQEGIVNTVILAPRFESTDTDIPVRLWKTLLQPYGTEIVVGLDTYLQPAPGMKPRMPSIETFAATAVSSYSQGADKLYFYNYFRNNIHDLLSDETECSEDPSLHICDNSIYKTVITKLASTDGALTLNRQHMITMKDTLPIWKRNTNYALTNRAANQLPLHFKRDGSFKIFVGEIPEGAELTLRFAVEEHEKAISDLPRTFVNSEACDYIGEIEDKRWYPEGKLLCYNIPPSAYLDVICPYIIVNGETVIRYVDVFVKVK